MTVYVLGAGLSAAAEGWSERDIRFPCQTNLFSIAGDVGGPELLERGSTLNAALGCALDIDRADPRFADCEWLLTAVDLRLAEQYDQELADLRAATIEWLCAVLMTVADTRSGTRTSSWHDMLADQLEPDDAIITFNYDLVMDWSIEKRYPSAFPASYGMRFNYLWDPSLEQWVERCPPTDVLFSHPLLKLHGSLNWGASHDRTVGIGGGPSALLCVPPNALGTYEEGSLMGHATSRCIVGPSYMKTGDIIGLPRIFGKLWAQARQRMADANNLIIIGYSLPAADVHAIDLLGRFAGASKSGRLTATVVDHRPVGVCQRLWDKCGFKNRVALDYHRSVRTFFRGGSGWPWPQVERI